MSDRLTNFTKGNHLMIIVIIVISSYGIYTGWKSLTSDNKWTNRLKNDVVERCIKDSGNNGIEFPELTKEYCECTMKEIEEQYSLNEYLRIVQLPIDEQGEYLMGVIQNCLPEYRTKINSLKEKTGHNNGEHAGPL